MMKKNGFSVEQIKRKLEQYCIYQERCHKEVERKLNEYSLIPQAKEIILLHLLEHNFLNEERFSRSFARGKFRIKKWGKKRIVRELKFRNISEYNIKSALKEINQEDYISVVYELVEKKNDTILEKNIFRKKEKIINYLLYRGYETDLIFKVINEVVS